MITREQFVRFEELRTLGEYNMITEYEQVIEELDMTEEEYNELLSDYDELREKYVYSR
jgi:hypothetical protein|tara:strand:+ start:274 stop:447 length:174 start_codon:yes stop_codon:yes gene_type:complete